MRKKKKNTKKKKKKKSSPLTPPPLQILNPEEPLPSSSSRELQIVNPTSPIFSTPFQLPPGWHVEERPRLNSPSNPGRVDKYYYEPETGLKFRSLSEIQRYLTGNTEVRTTPRRLKLKSNDEEYQYMQTFTTKSGSSFGLPDNWVVELRPRGNGVVDKYYIEPETKSRFRSRVAVETYLQSGRKSTSTTQAKPGCQTRSKSSGSRKKHISWDEVNDLSLDCTSPPAKVKWVLGGHGASVWSPFVGESAVPESVKQQWFDNFVSSILG